MNPKTISRGHAGLQLFLSLSLSLLIAIVPNDVELNFKFNLDVRNALLLALSGSGGSTILAYIVGDKYLERLGRVLQGNTKKSDESKD